MHTSVESNQPIHKISTRWDEFVSSAGFVSSYPNKENPFDSWNKKIHSGMNIPLLNTIINYNHDNNNSEIWNTNNINTFNIFYLLKGNVEIYDQKHQRTLTMIAGNAYCIFNHPGTKAKTAPGSSWINYLIPEHILRENFEKLTRRLYFREFPITSFRGIHSQVAMAFYQALCNASEDLVNATSSARGALAEAYEHLLLTKLCMTVTTQHDGDKGTATASIMPRYLQHAEAFMRRSLDRQVTLNDLAAAAGCGPRALQRMFKDYRNATPMQILCNYRLAAAYEAIAGGSAKNVTELSFRLRFSSPGRFSILFKKAYGKSPSAMIRFPNAGI